MGKVKTNRMVKKLSELGFDIRRNADQNEIFIQGNISHSMKALNCRASLPFDSKLGNGVKARSTLAENDSEAGGSIADLLSDLEGNIDMKPFYSEKERLAKSGLLEKLQTIAQDLGSRRKRRFSEHDGEWLMHREWEIAPYQETYRCLMPEKAIEIRCNFSIAWSAEPEEINRYGAMAWALSDIIETSGIRSRIVIFFDVNMHNANTGNGYCGIEIELKRANEYVSPSLLACAFQSKYYRKTLFLLNIAAAECANYRVSYSLGSCIFQKRPIEFKEGILTVSPDVSRGYSQDIEREILKAIGAKQA